MMRLSCRVSSQRRAPLSVCADRMLAPADLSVSLGVGGEFLHPPMVAAMEKIRDSCVAHGIAPGTQTRGIPQAKFWRERGMRFLGCSNETTMLFDRATEIVRELS